MWIIVLILLFLIFGRNLNLGASLTSVIQGAHESPLSSAPGTTPGIPGPSGYGTTFNAPSVPSTPGPFPAAIGVISAPVNTQPITVSAQPLPARTTAPINPSQALLYKIFGGGPKPTAPIIIANEAPLPVTNLSGRQTAVPENGGTFFTRTQIGGQRLNLL
jgi:hypothetical protein